MITQEELKALIDYSPENGLIIWKPRAIDWFTSKRSCSTWNARYAGKEAGGVQEDRRGYRRRVISILGKRYHEHRVVWLYMTGSLPIEEIDHKDRDATNNRWANLRQVPRSRNNFNLSKRQDNRSGFTGVSWDRRRAKWLARVKMNSEIILDEVFSSKEEAAKAASNARAKAGFSAGHGLDRAYE